MILFVLNSDDSGIRTGYVINGKLDNNRILTENKHNMASW